MLVTLNFLLQCAYYGTFSFVANLNGGMITSFHTSNHTQTQTMDFPNHREDPLSDGPLPPSRREVRMAVCPPAWLCQRVHLRRQRRWLHTPRLRLWQIRRFQE